MICTHAATVEAVQAPPYAGVQAPDIVLKLRKTSWSHGKGDDPMPQQETSFAHPVGTAGDRAAYPGDWASRAGVRA
jgi:hypothetical protein